MVTRREENEKRFSHFRKLKPGVFVLCFGSMNVKRAGDDKKWIQNNCWCVGLFVGIYKSYRYILVKT